MQSTLRDRIEAFVPPITLFAAGVGFLSGTRTERETLLWSGSLAVGYGISILWRWIHSLLSQTKHGNYFNSIHSVLALLMVGVGAGLGLNQEIFVEIGFTLGLLMYLGSHAAGTVVYREILHAVLHPGTPAKMSLEKRAIAIGFICVDFAALLYLVHTFFSGWGLQLGALSCSVICLGLFEIARNPKLAPKIGFLKRPSILILISSLVGLMVFGYTLPLPALSLGILGMAVGLANLFVSMELWMDSPRFSWSKRLAEHFSLQSVTSHLTSSWYALWSVVIVLVFTFLIFGMVISGNSEQEVRQTISLCAIGLFLVRTAKVVLGLSVRASSVDHVFLVLLLALLSPIEAGHAISAFSGLIGGLVILLVVLALNLRPFIEGAFFAKLRDRLSKEEGRDDQMIAKRLGQLAENHARRQGGLTTLVAVLLGLVGLERLGLLLGLDKNSFLSGWLWSLGLLVLLVGGLVESRRRLNRLAQRYVEQGALGGQKSSAHKEAFQAAQSATLIEFPISMAISLTARLAMAATILLKALG